jgi:aryl-alcohol dehydrogenase-like predicted oxidoreductase
MQYRALGRTELTVSKLALGTVSLGTDYGIKVPGESGRLAQSDAIRLIHQAVDVGINLFDTAPSYGESERLLGEALKSCPQCLIATKVSLPTDTNGKLLFGNKFRGVVQKSLDCSLKALQRDVLDIVQIHNATAEDLAQGEIVSLLLDAKQQGKIRFLGASVYGEAAALAVIESKQFDVLQVAYNLLDQRMAQRVFPAAERASVGVIVRSVFLKGVLTPRAQWLPKPLAELRQAADRIRETFRASWQVLPEVALRFCLSTPQVTTVLTGASTPNELRQAIAAAEAGPFAKQQLAATSDLGLSDERLLNPFYWPIP